MLDDQRRWWYNEELRTDNVIDVINESPNKPEFIWAYIAKYLQNTTMSAIHVYIFADDWTRTSEIRAEFATGAMELIQLTKKKLSVHQKNYITLIVLICM